MDKQFKEELNKVKAQKIPAESNRVVSIQTDTTAKLEQNELTKYQSGVGGLLYLSKLSRPDISNAVRDLSRTMKCASLENMRNLIKTIKFVVGTKEKDLTLKKSPNFKGSWEIGVYSDSDWGGCLDTLRSVRGWVILVNNNPITWRSTQQKTTALSSSEAEYIALSELCMDVMHL